jgi:hypothetical protein
MQKWKTSVSGFRSKCAMKRVQEKLKQKQIKNRTAEIGAMITRTLERTSYLG